MKCEVWRAEISAWMDDEIDDQSQRALFEHLTACPECRTFLESARKIERELKRVRPLYYGFATNRSIDAAPVLRRRILMSVSSLVLTLFLAAFVALMIGISFSRARAVEASSAESVTSQQGMIRSYSWTGQQ